MPRTPPARPYLVLLSLIALASAACASSPSTGGTGGASGPVGSGGSQAAGGTATRSAAGGHASGGASPSSSATGGNSAGGAGGAGSGGWASPGGNSGTGGHSSSGGTGGRTSATGGNTASGGGSGTASGGDTGATGGGGSGGTATGGKGGSGTGGSGTGGATGGSGGTDPFTLAWQDDFDALDTSLWQAQSFTWDGNQAQFTPQNVSVASGKLTLSLTNAPSGSAKPYLGVELRSTKTLTYGKVSASMRFAKGSGVVSGLVLFYTPYPNCDWNEIDIEHLGNSSQTSQLNCMVYTGKVVPNCTTSVSPTQDPQVVSLGGDAEAAFHQYDIEWTPAGVKFFVDGTLLRTWTANISLLKLPLNILLTIWASNSASWAGALDASSAPTSAEVDWIKVYSWKG